MSDYRSPYSLGPSNILLHSKAPTSPIDHLHSSLPHGERERDTQTHVLGGKCTHHPSFMDPTSKRNPSNTLPSDPFPSSSLLKTPTQHPKRNALHKAFAPRKGADPHRIDTHMQAKAMAHSINAGPSIPEKKPQQLHLKHPHTQKPTTTTTTVMTKAQKPTTTTKIKDMEKKKGGGAAKGREEGKGVEDEKRLVLLDGGRRRSFSGSELDLGAFLSGVGAKVVAKDMPPFMQIHAVSCAKKTHDGLEKFSSKALAFSLKKEFDRVYGPAWHCIVGTSFGSFVTHSAGGFIYFSMDKLHILLFKTTVQRAE
ncbi:intrastrand cross-link recognition-like protein [Cinnamomum micranthum f. kanehirae]|uniref:Intrastrand cross-link recognition-like protein n=1 Tax=Cinnamomum micranthum f. kanehirae TaxID=337451 RepID=A0A443NGM9_9MAGN|nr:intrastrand cross-link recognition-like protein [Cinnamomum micranthum f. kanehirae]